MELRFARALPYRQHDHPTVYDLQKGSQIDPKPLDIQKK
jgi:hypothetical protein